MQYNKSNVMMHGKLKWRQYMSKDYILLPLWTADPSFSQSSKISPNAGFKPSGDEKIRLVAQGYTQEDRIDYDEVFIEEEVYVCQPPGFEDPDFPDIVYKVEKALMDCIKLPELVLKPRYLKGQPKLGLWYPKDSPFDLVAYTDSDYAGASLDRKSTIGGCQFLGCRLISWQCKKQTVVANSTIEAEYVAASSCC
ncbi:hypothetical protein Tco_0737499 [Tanacetum coccineum]